MGFLIIVTFHSGSSPPLGRFRSTSAFNAREVCATMGRWVLGREGGQAGAPEGVQARYAPYSPSDEQGDPTWAQGASRGPPGAQAAPAQPQAALAPVHVPCAPGGSGATQVRPPDLTPKRGWTPSS